MQAVTETAWWQGDLVFDRPGLAVRDRNIATTAFKHSVHCCIVVGNEGGEVVNTLLAGPISQTSQQLRRESSALPGVSDRHRHFGSDRVFGVPDEPSDTQANTIAGIHRSKGLVVVVVDLGEVAHLCRGQARLAGQESQLARLCTQPGKSVGQQPGVLRLNGSDQGDGTIPQLHLVTDHGRSLGGTKVRIPLSYLS